MDIIRFGTDGWRAVIADTFTFANLDRVAQATAAYWSQAVTQDAEKKVVVGYDRRFLSDRFAARTAEIFAGNHFRVVLSDAPVPTPAVSYWVKHLGAVGGVVITASHNPPEFNGFKLKARFGGSADQAICNGVESLLDREPVKAFSLEDAIRRKRVQRRALLPRYLRAIKKLVDFDLIARSPLRFAHEALYGVGAGCFDTLLKGTRCRVTTLHAEHNPGFGGLNPEPISRNYGPGRAYLRKHPHDLCLVTDGDADRVGGMDGRGEPLSTHQLICLLLSHMIKNRNASGRVVKALTTTSMVDKICQAHGLELVETGVGFKYIAAEMRKGGVLLGFEESGGIGFPDHLPERDGILAGLMLLELLAREQRSVRQLLSGLERRYGPHRYARFDTHYPLDQRPVLMDFCKQHPPVRLLGSPVREVKTFDGVKLIARNHSWLMLRGSGTEPILRIYAEAQSDDAAQRLIRLGRRMANQVARTKPVPN